MAGADGKRVVDLSLICQCSKSLSQDNTPGQVFSYRCKVLSFTLQFLQQLQNEVIDILTADKPLLHLPLGEIAEQLRAGTPD